MIITTAKQKQKKSTPDYTKFFVFLLRTVFKVTGEHLKKKQMKRLTILISHTDIG